MASRLHINLIVSKSDQNIALSLNHITSSHDTSFYIVSLQAKISRSCGEVCLLEIPGASSKAKAINQQISKLRFYL